MEEQDYLNYISNLDAVLYAEFGDSITERVPVDWKLEDCFEIDFADYRYVIAFDIESYKEEFSIYITRKGVFVYELWEEGLPAIFQKEFPEVLSEIVPYFKNLVIRLTPKLREQRIEYERRIEVHNLIDKYSKYFYSFIEFGSGRKNRIIRDPGVPPVIPDSYLPEEIEEYVKNHPDFLKYFLNYHWGAYSDNYMYWLLGSLGKYITRNDEILIATTYRYPKEDALYMMRRLKMKEAYSLSLEVLSRCVTNLQQRRFRNQPYDIDIMNIPISAALFILSEHGVKEEVYELLKLLIQELTKPVEIINKEYFKSLYFFRITSRKERFFFYTCYEREGSSNNYFLKKDLNDSEIRELCRIIKKYDLRAVLPERIYYKKIVNIMDSRQ